ncbi:hypothetical protein [Methylocucumis oryzae]|uniref:Cytochrome c domain-containing protein n=1 Tax=Methylocucumis oryzae TaxID=1632867 RepID=A0A0F3IHE7_9GAMM|nr:hypothetical protein [Methylocucumis oryzae]KJV06102.1 hypothetical protein VZ94_13380 [Methylocucumis oryzae]
MSTQTTHKQWSGLLLLTASSLLTGTALAREEYVPLTGAESCLDCHRDLEGNGYTSGVLDAWNSGEIEGLKKFIEAKNNTGNTNTAPVLHAINSKWDITVGESALVIPLQVTDAEDDSFALHGTAPTGYSVSDVYIKNGLSTVDFKWSPTAAQANKTYTVKLYVQETGDGRSLKSNTITSLIKVWPARKTATKQVGTFQLQSAQWKSNAMTLTGLVTFKSNVTAAQRTAALAKLTMSVSSANGKVVSTPVKLAPNSAGTWTKKFTLGASKVPCSVKVNYEGLIGMRSVSLAPAATCVK